MAVISPFGSPSGPAPMRVSGMDSAASHGPYAALDLGTNNCRLLIAAPRPGGFRVVDAYSRIVRLGEGLSQTGRLQPAAMERARPKVPNFRLKIASANVLTSALLETRSSATF